MSMSMCSIYVLMWGLLIYMRSITVVVKVVVGIHTIHVIGWGHSWDIFLKCF